MQPAIQYIFTSVCKFVRSWSYGVQEQKSGSDGRGVDMDYASFDAEDSCGHELLWASDPTSWLRLHRVHGKFEAS